MKAAIEQGMADAWKELQDFERTEINTGRVTPGNLFGTREFLKNNYLNRWTGVVLGIYANSKAEALYPIYRVDAAGDKLDASKNRYVLRFAPGQLPPVNAFWSLTMYDLPQSLLVANPLNRYLINSPMLPNLKLDADGGLTIYIQRESPGSRQRSQLASGAEGFVLDGPAPLLAEGRGGGWQVETSAAESGDIRRP